MREYGKGIHYVSIFITLSCFFFSNFCFVLFLYDCFFFVSVKKSSVSILSIISTVNAAVIVVSVIISISIIIIRIPHPSPLTFLPSHKTTVRIKDV